MPKIENNNPNNTENTHTIRTLIPMPLSDSNAYNGIGALRTTYLSTTSVNRVTTHPASTPSATTCSMVSSENEMPAAQEQQLTQPQTKKENLLILLNEKISQANRKIKKHENTITKLNEQKEQLQATIQTLQNKIDRLAHSTKTAVDNHEIIKAEKASAEKALSDINNLIEQQSNIFSVAAQAFDQLKKKILAAQTEIDALCINRLFYSDEVSKLQQAVHEETQQLAVARAELTKTQEMQKEAAHTLEEQREAIGNTIDAHAFLTFNYSRLQDEIPELKRQREQIIKETKTAKSQLEQDENTSRELQKKITYQRSILRELKAGNLSFFVNATAKRDQDNVTRDEPSAKRARHR